MIRRRALCTKDYRLLFCLAVVFVCAFAGCKHPPKQHSVSGYRKMQQTVETLAERGITIDLDLLKPGATYWRMFRAGRIPADEAFERYGMGMFGGSHGKVACQDRRISESDLQLLADLPALKEFTFSECSWEDEAGRTPEARKSLASATKLSLQETPAPQWVFAAPGSSRLTVLLEAAELSATTVAAAISSNNVWSLTLVSKSSVEGAFAGLSGSGVQKLTARLPVSDTDFQEILRCNTLKDLRLYAESPVDAEAVVAIAAMEQIQSFNCVLVAGTDLQQVISANGKWEYCRLGAAGEGATHFSLSRYPPRETPVRWPDDSPAIRAAHAASLPAPNPPQLSVPDTYVLIEPLKQRITFSGLKNAKDLHYASSVPGIHEVRFGFGEVEVSGSELAEELKKLPHIHTVELPRKSSRRSDVIAALASLPNLQILKISSPQDDEFAELQKLTKLQRLEVSAQYGNPLKEVMPLPSVPELAIRKYWLPADTLAEFLEVNKSARIELVYHNHMPVYILCAAANSDLQQLVLVPIGRFSDDKIDALRRAWPGYRTEQLKLSGVAYFFSRGG